MRLTSPEADSQYNNKTNLEHIMKELNIEELSIEEMTALRGGMMLLQMLMGGQGQNALLPAEQWLGLKINRDKTRIYEVKASESGLDFLGYNFQLAPSPHGPKRRYWRIAPSKKSEQREVARIREMISNKQRSLMFPPGVLADPLASGWSNRYPRGIPSPHWIFAPFSQRTIKSSLPPGFFLLAAIFCIAGLCACRQ